ncbi:MAG: prepilin-type N-terminal cleavage/methylation domain-containing protein [Elusimicrobiaceae bacterium]|nr:prepilin-type N-terminal cleavage/methylation domain-containing protein [Elusimicrobiaceae bacterium]
MVQQKRAFTLIELLVVVLIIGILAAVALPQYQKAVNKARITEALIILKAITDAQEVYYLANGKYTSNISDLDISTEAAGNYFEFSCGDRSCSATYKQEEGGDWPVLMFHMMQFSGVDAHIAYLGKHWCIARTPKWTARAVDICKSLGVADFKVGEGYYVMNKEPYK